VWFGGTPKIGPILQGLILLEPRADVRPVPVVLDRLTIADVHGSRGGVVRVAAGEVDPALAPDVGRELLACRIADAVGMREAGAALGHGTTDRRPHELSGKV
jgi:hypothetical protein